MQKKTKEEIIKSEKVKGHRHFKRALKILLLLLAVVIVALVALLYAPVRTIASLEKVDDFPLYVMNYRGGYFFDLFAKEGIDWSFYQKVYKATNPDACTSFTTHNPDGETVYGRNFDWKHRSSLLLFTDPPSGYASVSMVDLYYLGLEGMQEIPWAKRLVLLGAPYATIDGMNECGVAIAQNAVPRRNFPKDPNKPTLLNSQIVRLVLDHAKDVDEALTLIRQYNIDFADVCVHFHIADVSGNSAVVEYMDDGISIIRGEQNWQVSTNYLFSEPVQPECWRYKKASASLAKEKGDITENQAMSILQGTSQDTTTWSIVYNLSTGRIRLALGKDYNQIHTFELGIHKNRQ